MSIQNEMPGYNDVDQLLNQQGVGLTPAEMHGLISGILCGGNTDSSWQPLVHDLTNEGLAFGHELAQALRSMHSATSDSLEDDGFLFQLYMPEGDNVSVFDRADALAGWVNHFLLGLGVTQPKLDKVKDETGEAIDDLRNIAQLGYDEDEDRKSWKCLSKRLLSTYASPRYCATIPSRASSQPHRKYASQRYTK